MDFLFGARILEDICLYYAFANFLPRIFGNWQLSFLAPVMVWLSAMTGYLISKKTWNKHTNYMRYLPLVLPVVALIYNFSAQQFVIMFPSWAYVFVVMKMNRLDLCYADVRNSFFTGLKVLPFTLVPVVFSVKMENFGPFSQYCLPFVILFLVCGFFTLKIARHQRETLESSTIKIVSMFSLLGILGISRIMTMESITDGFFGMLGLAYEKAIMPVLLWIAKILAYPFLLFGEFLNSIMVDNGGLKDNANIDLAPTMDSGLGVEAGKVEIPQEIKYFAIAIGIIIGCVIIYFVFKKLIESWSKTQNVSYSTETRTYVKDQRAPRDIIPPTDPTEQVRFYYRKYLRNVKKAGYSLKKSDTSKKVLDEANKLLPQKAKAGNDLRELYVKTRYMAPGFTPKQGEAKSLYQASK